MSETLFKVCFIGLHTVTFASRELMQLKFPDVEPSCFTIRQRQLPAKAIVEACSSFLIVFQVSREHKRRKNSEPAKAMIVRSTLDRKAEADRR